MIYHNCHNLFYSNCIAPKNPAMYCPDGTRGKIFMRRVRDCGYGALCNAALHCLPPLAGYSAKPARS